MRIAGPVISGLRSTWAAPGETGSDVVVAMVTPSADAIGIQTACRVHLPPHVGRCVASQWALRAAHVKVPCAALLDGRDAV
jgi:hypothetical protein